MTADEMDGDEITTSLDPGLARRLAALGRLEDRALPLGRAALLLANISAPEKPLAPYEAHLDEIACAVAELQPGRHAVTVERAGQVLAEVLAGRYRYEGDRDNYDDMQNANLMRVIDRRRGLPVALGILYAEIARAQGWQLTGLNFPGHFLMRLDVGGERRVLDPFNRGRLVDPPEMRALLTQVEGADAPLRPQHYAPVGNRDILLRLQNNLKVRLLRSGGLIRALAVVDGMVLLAPDLPWHWRERGLIHQRLGQPTAAIADLERFCLLARRHGLPQTWERETSVLIASIQRSLN